MSTMFLCCLMSSDQNALIFFCMACTALLSLSNLATASDPAFGVRYGWLILSFGLVPAVLGLFILYRERARIFGDSGLFLEALIPGGITIAAFFMGYRWYIRTHGVEQDAAPESKLSE
jgi:hypothetical protein